MKRRRGDPLLNGPIYRAPEHVFAVIIHSDGIQHPPKPGSIQESIFEMKEHELKSIVNHATGLGIFDGVVVQSGQEAPGGDHHDMWIDPANANRMVVGHDQEQVRAGR